MTQLDVILNRVHNDYAFDPDTSISSLADKVILVTGGTAGLGLETIVQLVKHSPSRIFLPARSQSKYDHAIAEIAKRSTPTARDIVTFVAMDLASLRSVKAAATQILATTTRLDILINNAGIMGAAPGLTEDGYEVHFGTNHMGHALLTQLLIPLMQRTPDARIVNVSSGAFALADKATGFSPDLVRTDMARYAGSSGNLMSRYGGSKLANVLYTKALARHYPTITTVAVAPGRVKTGLLDGMYRDGRDRFYGWFQRAYDVVVGALTVEQGAYTQLWAATEQQVGHRLESGAMYQPIGRREPGTPLSNDDGQVEKLWSFTLEELKPFL